MHLNIGLDKLRQTEEDVEALRRGLAVKEAELTLKNKEASDKLQTIIAEQAEAEQQKTVIPNCCARESSLSCDMVAHWFPDHRQV